MSTIKGSTYYQQHAVNKKEHGMRRKSTMYLASVFMQHHAVRSLQESQTSVPSAENTYHQNGTGTYVANQPPSAMHNTNTPTTPHSSGCTPKPQHAGTWPLQSSAGSYASTTPKLHSRPTMGYNHNKNSSRCCHGHVDDGQQWQARWSCCSSTAEACRRC